MADRDLDICEVCGDDLCPGCNPEVRVTRVVWLGLAAFVTLALGWRGIELIQESVNTGADATPSSTEVVNTSLPSPSTSMLPVESSSTTLDRQSTTSTSSSVPPPTRNLGPLDHHLMQEDRKSVV